MAYAAPPGRPNRRKWVVASAIGAAAALSIGVFAATRDEGSTAVPPSTTAPASTTPRRPTTSVPSTEQPSTGSGRRGSQPSTGQTPSTGGSQSPSSGQTPSSGRTPSGGSSQSPSTGGGSGSQSPSNGDQGSSLFPDNGDGSIQLPNGTQLPDLGQLPGFNGESLDQIIRDILRRLGIDPDTVLPPAGSGSSTPGSSSGTSGVN